MNCALAAMAAKAQFIGTHMAMQGLPEEYEDAFTNEIHAADYSFAAEVMDSIPEGEVIQGGAAATAMLSECSDAVACESEEPDVYGVGAGKTAANDGIRSTIGEDYRSGPEERYDMQGIPAGDGKITDSKVETGRMTAIYQRRGSDDDTGRPYRPQKVEYVTEKGFESLHPVEQLQFKRVQTNSGRMIYTRQSYVSMTGTYRPGKGQEGGPAPKSGPKGADTAGRQHRPKGSDGGRKRPK